MEQIVIVFSRVIRAAMACNGEFKCILLCSRDRCMRRETPPVTTWFEAVGNAGKLRVLKPEIENGFSGLRRVSCRATIPG